MSNKNSHCYKYKVFIISMYKYINLRANLWYFSIFGESKKNILNIFNLFSFISVFVILFKIVVFEIILEWKIILYDLLIKKRDYISLY